MQCPRKSMQDVMCIHVLYQNVHNQSILCPLPSWKVYEFTTNAALKICNFFTCTAGFFELEGNCVLQCPTGYSASEDGRNCEQCDGPCRKGVYTLSQSNFVFCTDYAGLRVENWEQLKSKDELVITWD